LAERILVLPTLANLASDVVSGAAITNALRTVDIAGGVACARFAGHGEHILQGDLT
jgi:hypothetical protein